MKNDVKGEVDKKCGKIYSALMDKEKTLSLSLTITSLEGELSCPGTNVAKGVEGVWVKPDRLFVWFRFEIHFNFLVFSPFRRLIPSGMKAGIVDEEE